MRSSDPPRERASADFQRADGQYVGRERRRVGGEPGEAIQPAGGVGGASGTGQMRPHHGFGDPAGRPAGRWADEAEIAPATPENGPTYQTGGIGRDRALHVEERKRRGIGVSSTRGHGVGGSAGGLDPPPGAPSSGGRV